MHNFPIYTELREGMEIGSIVTIVNSHINTTIFFQKFIPVGIPEFDNGQRSSSAGVVNDVLHNSLDVSVTLGIVGRPD